MRKLRNCAGNRKFLKKVLSVIRNGEELETVLAREHGQIQRLKNRGFSDEDIDALGENEGETTKNSEEDDNESEIF